MKKAVPILIFCMVCAGWLHASVGIEVGDGIKVETTSGVQVVIDGDITETGTGYFSGKLSSGSRTGMTAFAGITLGSAMDGAIIRYTGAAYSGGHGEGTNFKRWYSISNSGREATGSLSVAYVSSGTHDETNGLAIPFFIYRYASAWKGYGTGSSASPVTASSVTIPVGDSEWVLSEGVRIAVKVWLEGTYDDAMDSMRTFLRGNIPTTSPYADDNRTVVSVPGQVTDWILLQVRSFSDSTNTAGSRSCFINKLGMLVGDDGTTEYASVNVPGGDYFLVIKHRNHLAVRSYSAVTGLAWGSTPSTYDFSTGTNKYKGKEAALLETGVYGMYAGDTNGSGIVTNSDKDPIITNLNNAGYYDADSNLSGIVTNADKDPIITNLNKATNTE